MTMVVAQEWCCCWMIGDATRKPHKLQRRQRREERTQRPNSRTARRNWSSHGERSKCQVNHLTTEQNQRKKTVKSNA